MKKSLFKTAMLAAIVSLFMSGSAFAHHPLYTINPELFERIDDILEETNSRHNEIVGDVEDYEFMGSMTETMDGIGTATSQTQVMDGDMSSTMTVNQGIGTVPGAGSAAMSGDRVGARNQ